MVQIIKSNGGGGGGGGASYTAGNGIEISAQNEISVDEAVVQTVGNMVDNLTGADDDHYPTAKAVADAISGGGNGDVVGPNSSTDEDVVVFDGVTGKLIKDSGVKLSSKLDASALSDNNYGGAWENDSTHTPTKRALYDKIHTMDVEIGNKAADNTVVKLTGNQTINGSKTFGTSPIVPSKTADATNTGTAIATEAQVYNVAEDVDTINGKIPSAATSSNQLADKNYVDDSINSVTAYYITKNAQGDQWATYAELAAASTFYSGGVARTPTRNDYTIVLADENHDNATTRYIYNSGWEYQYTVNETALTQAQLNALNSGITAAKVSTYDAYATNKQDKLVNQTNIKSINNNSLLGSGNITLNDVKISATAPSSPTEGMVWYDTTNDQLKVYDGTNWNITGKEYNAGEGISIGNITINGRKGPSPDGFHVPSITEWEGVKTIMDGLNLTSGDDWMNTLFIPFAGFRNRSNASLSSQGSYGYYWSSSPYSEDSNRARYLALDSSSVYASVNNRRANGLSVRCFKDSYVAPTSSWTVIYGTLGNAGIFRDQTNGLISITSDGSTGYTIMDKNLGATTVYDYGDVLSEANMGYMYQWGNNYGFPSTGTISNTSSTQVDASVYGPTNPYSSSTFITGNQDWSSVQNDDLWGDTTGTITQENVITNTGVLSVNGNHGAVTVQPTLVSGTNIKTVNSNSLLGNGNISLNEVPSGGTNGDVLTNVNGTATWQAPTGGDVMVSSQPNNILTSGMKIWAGTESDYGNLGTYDSNTVYLTI